MQRMCMVFARCYIGAERENKELARSETHAKGMTLGRYVHLLGSYTYIGYSYKIEHIIAIHD